MSIIDTFAILFRSNAKEVIKDEEALDKKTKELQENISKTDEKTKNLGISFGDLVGAITAATGVSFGASALKSAIGNVISMEVELGRLSKLTGVSADDISAWDAALQRFGAPAGEFISWLDSVNKYYVSIGRGGDVKNILPNLIELAEQWKNMDIATRQLRANQLGLSQNMVLMFDQGGEGLTRMIEQMKRAQSVTKEDTEAAQELANAWNNVERAIVGALAKLILHPIDSIKEGLSNLAGDRGTVNWEEVNKKGVKPWGPSWFRMEGKKSVSPGANSNMEESRRFWLSQGYSPEQVAGLLANEQRESNFDPRAVGDNGAARGIFQWHPDRRAAILSATGIDISNAGHLDQLKAAQYELGQGIGDSLKSTRSPGEAAALFSNKFERPANAQQEAALRASSAEEFFSSIKGAQGVLSAADQSPLNTAGANVNKTTSVTIGHITVQTQATDANGIANGIANALNTHLTDQMRTAVGNYDDSILY